MSQFPVWPIALSDQLPIVALVGHYPTNKLIGRGPILKQKPELPFSTEPYESAGYPVLAILSKGYPGLQGRLPTCYSPVRRFLNPKVPFSLDLHVLSTPPAFVLSQDQTLHERVASQISARRERLASLIRECQSI